MEDKLEKFIRDNRSALDDKVPGEKVWDNISSELFEAENKKPTTFSVYWKAAAIFFFALSAYLLVQLNRTDPAESAGNDLASNIIQEFNTTEAYYLTEISTLKSSMVDYVTVDPELSENFIQDIETLDNQYQSLKIELSENSNENVINALILNLQMRLEILNQQLNILKNLENDKNDNNKSI